MTKWSPQSLEIGTCNSSLQTTHVVDKTPLATVARGAQWVRGTPQNLYNQVSWCALLSG